MIEVEVHNFQSVLKETLQIDGFTAIEGRSNIGKSALIRAIEHALTGAVGSDFVRHGSKCDKRSRGAKKCRCFSYVRITAPEVEVIWEKGDEVNKYTITRNGEKKEYTAFERGDPDFLQPDFRRIQVGDTKQVIQVADQWNPIFLLKESGSTIADVLSDVARLDDINEAMRLVVKDKKDTSSKKKIREGDLEKTLCFLDAYDGLDEVLLKVKGTDTLVNRLELAQEELNLVEQFSMSVPLLADAINRLKLAGLPQLPEWSSVVRAYEGVGVLATYEGSYLDKSATIARLTPIAQIQIGTPIEKLKESCQQLVSLDDWLRKLRAIKSDFAVLQNVNALPDPSISETLQATERLQKLQPLANRYLTLVELERELTKAHLEAEVVEAELLGEFQDLGVCPTCTQDISPEHYHRKSA